MQIFNGLAPTLLRSEVLLSLAKWVCMLCVMQVSLSTILVQVLSSFTACHGCFRSLSASKKGSENKVLGGE